MNSDGCWDNVNIVQNDEQPYLNNTVTDEGSKIKTFTVKNYIPKRSAKTLLKLPHIIGIAVIIILIIIIILLASIKKKSTSSVEYTKAAEVINNTSVLVECTIVMSDGTRFWMYNPQAGSLKLIWEVKNSTQAFVIDETKTLYWIETNSWKIFSLNLSETKKNESLFFEGSSAKLLKNPSMALDPINNNLYIVDESIIGLVIINTVTKYYALMSIDLVNPRYVVLDAAKGFMFVGSTTWIKRADMDGDNLLTIISSKSISSITLDPEGEKIYWIHNSEVIEKSDYSGQQTQQLATELDYFVDLTFLDDHLFWLKNSSDIQHNIIWSCKVLNGVCTNHTMHSNAASNATFIKATSFSQNNSRGQNSSNHQNCQHISLPTPGGQVSCVCNMSLQLFYDTMCKSITKFILYTMNGDVRARNMDVSKKVILEPIWPTPYYNETLLKEKNNIDFDYDFENDDFYFSDDSKIYKIKLKGINPQQEVVLTVDSSDFYIQNLAYDWLTENMYYLKMSKIPYLENSIVVFNVKKGAGFQKSLTNLVPRIDFYGQNTLITYPGRGLLFLVTFQPHGLATISLFISNGTLITKFDKSVYNQLISIDYEVDRLCYWGFSRFNTLKYINFNGTEYRIEKILETPTSYNIKFISIDGQWIYIFPTNSGNVYRMNKKTGIYSNFGSPLNYPAQTEPSGVRIINQIQIKENPCRMHNGGCEQLCFFGSNVTCDCADGFLVTSKGLCTRP